MNSFAVGELFSVEFASNFNILYSHCVAVNTNHIGTDGNRFSTIQRKALEALKHVGQACF